MEVKEGKICKCVAHITCPFCDTFLSFNVNGKDLDFNYDGEDRFWKVKCPQCGEVKLNMGKFKDEKVVAWREEKLDNPKPALELDEATIIKRFAEKVGSHIAGHSDYHGDNILSALYAAAEGKEIKDVKPLER